jgi:hypothetical protein
MVHIYNGSTQEAEAGETQLKVSWATYWDLVSKEQKKKNQKTKGEEVLTI